MLFPRFLILILGIVVVLSAPVFCQEGLGDYEQAKIQFDKGNYQEAIYILTPVLSEAKSAHQNHPFDSSLWDAYASALYLLGDSHWWAGNYSETENLFREYLALVSDRYGEKYKNYADRTADLAALYYDLGRYQESEKLYLNALELDGEIHGIIHLDLIGTWNNLAVLYDAMGKYGASESLYQQVLEGYRDLAGTLHPYYATALSNLAAFYNSMGRYSEAEPLLEEAVGIHLETQGENSRQYATALNNLAMVNLSMDQIKKARELLTKSLEIKKNIMGEGHWDYLISMSNLAKIYLDEGNPEKAVEITETICQAYLELFGNLHPSYLNALTNQAGAYLRMGQYQKAGPMLKQVVEARREVLGPQHPDYAHALSNLASVYVGDQFYEQAESHLLESLDLYADHIQTYFPGLSEREQEKYYDLIKGEFEAFNSFVLEQQPQSPELIGRMFDSQLFTKALLLDASRKVRKSLLQSGDSLLMDQFNHWQALRETSAKLRQQSELDQGTLQEKIDSLQRAINELEKEISLKSGLFSQVHGKPSGWREVQAVLQEGEAAVEMVRFRKYDLKRGGKFTDTVYYAALIIAPEPARPKLVWMDQGNLMEGRLFQAYRRDMQESRNESDAYSYFWKPIQEALQGINKIYFSPDGIFHQINPGTLFKSDVGKYLADELVIVLLTSTRDLLKKADSQIPKTNANVVLMGFPDYALEMESTVEGGQEVNQAIVGMEQDPEEYYLALDLQPLPGTKMEIEQIARILKAQGLPLEIYLEQKATEGNIKKLKRPKILHIATHGFFEGEVETAAGLGNPLFRSGLFLAGAGKPVTGRLDSDGIVYGQDGIFTAYEAVGLDLEGTELVVLSACETALGEIRIGEGVDGLQRAFRLAGSEAVLMSLWKIDDRVTQELMTAFYRNWMEGKEKQEAFHSAQLEIRKLYPEPFFWGAFVMVGI
jgi:CHAT domain-containing protein/Tfp pilus assembly protein PilF